MATKAATATTYINQKMLADLMGLSKQRVSQFIDNGALPVTYEPDLKSHGIRIVDAMRFLLIQSAKSQGRSHHTSARANLYYKAAAALLKLLPEAERDAVLPQPKAKVISLDVLRAKRNV